MQHAVRREVLEKSVQHLTIADVGANEAIGGQRADLFERMQIGRVG
jgi:hypothetical protein